MNIVVLGAGTVGRSIADLLCEREYSVTVIDINPVHVRRINEELDVRAICGSASQSSILFQAGIQTADICLAVTGNDEVNLIAASLAKAMGARRTIARVYSPVFRDLSTFDYRNHFNIDQVLSLEYLTAMEIARGIRGPGTAFVDQLLRGQLHVQEIIIGQESKITQSKIRDLGISSHIRIGTIQRENRMWMASADDQLEIGDRITVFSTLEEVKQVKTIFKTSSGPNRRIVIGGGGETGLHLALTLETEGFKVTLIEIDEQRCEQLATILDSTSIIHANAGNLDVLEEERVGNADVFVACTGDETDNIVMALEAQSIGTRKIMCVIGRSDYQKITAKLGVDLAVSERNVMARQIMSYLTEGIIVSRAKLPGGLINIIEVEVRENAPVTEAILAELDLPERCLIIGIIQQDKVRIPGANDRLSVGNIAILLVEDDVVGAALARFKPS